MRIDLDIRYLLKKSFATKLVSAIILRDTYQAVPSSEQTHPKVLLGFRKNTQHYSDYWSLPIGHVEVGESNLQAIKRELQEELSILAIDVEELFVKTNAEKSIQHQVFWVKQWQGKLANAEPQFCERIEWFESGNLPLPTTPITIKIVADFVNSTLFKLELLKLASLKKKRNLESTNLN